MLTMLESLWSPPLASWKAYLVATLFGVSLHLFYYIDGHHEPQSVSIAMIHLLLFPAIAVTVTMIHGLAVASFMDSLGFWAAIHLGLAVSMVLYRLVFHPLCRVPGPLWAKITKIPIMVVARRGKLHELHTEWARKYGPVVRIGQYSRVTQCH